MAERTRGRPSALTEEVKAELLQFLGLGLSIERACEAVGIAPASFHLWNSKGVKDKEAGRKTQFSEFSDATTRARARGVATRVARISKAAAKDWRADAWALEHMHAKDFAKRHEVTGPDGGPLGLQHSGSLGIKKFIIEPVDEDDDVWAARARKTMGIPDPPTTPSSETSTET